MKCNLSDRGIDGGYGVIIVCSSFCLVCITDGIFFSFGLLMVELIKEFNTDRATSAAVGSILIGVSGLGGLLFGRLCNKYGCKTATLIGSLISSIGLFVSFFATSIYFLYITYGCFGGIGLGLTYMAANIINVQYFSKHRGIACGIALSGSGVGTFAFNQVYRILIVEYGWRGTILLQSGICLQCLVFGLLLHHPLKMIPYSNDQTNNEKEKSIDINETMENNIYTIQDNFDIRSSSDEVTSDINVITTINFNDNLTNHEGAAKDTQLPRCANVFLQNKLNNSCLKNVYNEMFDRELIRDPRFWIFFASAVIVHLAFSVVINMTADSAIESGMSMFEASWLASSIGITNCVGKVIIGLLADLAIVNRIVMVTGLLVLAGISIAFSFLLTSFNARLIGATLYGAFIGGYLAICPVVLADVFTSAKIATSLGLYLFAFGFSASVSTPFGGFLFDNTGSYDVTFIVAGSELIVAGIIVLLILILDRKKKMTESSVHSN